MYSGAGNKVKPRLMASPINRGWNLLPFPIGSISSGTFIPQGINGNYQYLTNGGAFTLAAPGSDCAITLLVTNNASAGVITLSGFTVGASIGDALTTINTNKFLISIVRLNGVATYWVKALQ